jgi:transcriptional regulator with XRE-family HTH domain
MDYNTIINNSPDIILQKIAARVKEKRLDKNLTQKAFAERAGVGYDAYRKFETTGETTLRNMVQCAIVLDATDGFSELFAQKSWNSMDDLLKIEKSRKRKRGSKHE